MSDETCQERLAVTKHICVPLAMCLHEHTLEAPLALGSAVEGGLALPF